PVALRPFPTRRSSDLRVRDRAVRGFSARVAPEGTSAREARASLVWALQRGRRREDRAMKKLLTPVLAMSMLGLALTGCGTATGADRKSTRLNSSHLGI